MSEELNTLMKSVTSNARMRGIVWRPAQGYEYIAQSLNFKSYSLLRAHYDKLKETDQSALLEQIKRFDESVDLYQPAKVSPALDREV